MNNESNRYVLLLNRIHHKENGGFIDDEARAESCEFEEKIPFEQALLWIQSQNRARVYPQYFLTVQGDALATDMGWAVKGLDAIIYALIDRYAWEAQAVRRMDFRDQWLSLPDEAKQVVLDQAALEAWQQRYAVPLDEPGSAAWTIRDVPSIE